MSSAPTPSEEERNQLFNLLKEFEFFVIAIVTIVLLFSDLDQEMRLAIWFWGVAFGILFHITKPFFSLNEIKADKEGILSKNWFWPRVAWAFFWICFCAWFIDIA